MPLPAEIPGASIAISQPMIDTYAEISGDFNPLHVDIAAATATPFGGTIAHGCIPLEPVFQAVQRWLGRPALPSSTRMTLRYHRPSRPGDTISAVATLAEGEPDAGGHLRIAFSCTNQHGETVLDGECVVPASMTGEAGND